MSETNELINTDHTTRMGENLDRLIQHWIENVEASPADVLFVLARIIGATVHHQTQGDTDKDILALLLVGQWIAEGMEIQDSGEAVMVAEAILRGEERETD